MDNFDDHQHLLESLYTPEQIADRIAATSGVHLTARTVWEKARRLGIAKKIGRAMLIALTDIPLLLQPETKERRGTDRSTKAALAILAARKEQK